METNKRNMKTVSFADDITRVNLFTAEEAESPLWLSSQELQDLREKVREDAEDLKTKGYGILLKNGFDEGDLRAQKHINAFSQLPGVDYPRGTEVYLSNQHRDEVDRVHSKLVKSVLSRQRGHPDRLRNISRKHSRGSRIFARRLGIADQRAVREGDDLFKAQAMVKDLNQGNAKMAQRKASVQDMGVLTGNAKMAQRKASVQDMGCLTGKKNSTVGPIFGLAFVAAQIAQTKGERAPVNTLQSRPSAGAVQKCANVIQDALACLDLDDAELMGDPFTTPNFPQGVAKTA